ncbi:DUF5801 repeats-in-toxin domain-containing protein [Mesorhizobium sp. M6A.T.Ce.TU.016.01.1.1]|uniref:DUF5801 repeats-in-toxin domain-containing protein n=1 Tax=Mesorhizobium sp. M6A.T.Ce.TU.016.01.1.1 TaxID=2496783 RepID=UPI000FCA7402|nr:DUF5801 repeats-in-toxin domain-containing protein [Mesorhizobium sp. M6A.T.Ce.TU.016.01.1.1]RUU27884.1 hypothetical protein EOC94_20085 [Mesorhizobium sp. M6A.T.Ce.TU.016.01.1.1]
MAIDIVAQDIIIDETTGLQVEDDDVNPLDSPHSTDPTLQYLLGLDDAGGLTSPEVAFQTDFVVASASAGETITSVVLSQNLNGTPFSTTVGVNSDIQTVDGNYVWLFQDPTHANVVIGVIGTSDGTVAPDPTGPLAFSLGLNSTSNTNANLYTVQYVPLFHPDETNPDDRIDLTDKVFASVTGTTVVNFGQLGDAPPGHNNWYILDADVASPQKILVTAHDNGAQAEVNISTQGLGVASQDVRFGRELQIDLISGGTQSAGKDFTNTPTAPDYDAHIENVSGAGFSVSQSTPTNTVADIEIHAYNNDDNAEGANLPGDDNDTEINITGVTFKLNGVATTAAALGITVDLSGTGLILQDVGEGVTVDFTTAGGAGGTFDRFTIKNIDTEKDYFDVKEVHFSGAVANAHNEQVGSFINFDDDGPTLSITAAPTVGAAEVVEASGVGGQSQATITPPTFTASAVDGFTTNVTYALALAGGTATGLLTTAGNHAITLVADSASQISGQYDSDGNNTLDATAFTVTLSGTTVTLTSLVALEHSNAPQGAGEDNSLDLGTLINVVSTVTVTDGDDDVVSSQSASSGLSLTFNDTDPTITAPFDGDQTGAPGTPETLANTLNASATGAFGYDMTDKHTAAEYAAGVSDFVDTNGALAGTQIALTGTVDNAQNPNITQAVATRTAETDTSASFAFSFHYDKDPITAGVQDATAGGTLVFDKAADTYTVTLTDVIDGFSFDVLHTSELVAKAPTGNTGHPLIVAEQLTPNGDPDPFFVQFTANSTTQQIGFGFNSTGDGATVGDTTFNNGGATHDMITNTHEDWVSATRATNGVAGDTIQKGEVLTLRFFQENILGDVNPNAPGGGTERLDPTTSASGVVIKFDGIGNSEDLVLILDLRDANGNEITRAVNVQNLDLIKGNANVPFPYNTEFTLDNNDALLILESNDYNDGIETFQIQGVQIMQSDNGLTGTAINLNGAVGAGGDSSATSGLTAWDTTDNDVLKIVDIGFVQQTSGTISADLVFAFNVADADADQTLTQQILVDVA